MMLNEGKRKVLYWAVVLVIVIGAIYFHRRNESAFNSSDVKQQCKEDEDVSETCKLSLKAASIFLKTQTTLSALDEIEKCVELEPQDHNLQFQIGELYCACGEDDEGLAWIKRAFFQDAANFEYAHLCVEISSKQGDFIGGIRVGEAYLEKKLGLQRGDWQQTMLDVSYFPKEDLQWLVDAGNEVLSIVRDLHRLYNGAVWLPATNASFRILSTLYEDDFQLIQSFADFSASVGLFNQSLILSMNKLERQYGMEYPLVDAHKPVVDHSLVLLGSSLDPFLVNMARRLLIADNKDILDVIAAICGKKSGSLDKFMHTVYVTIEDTAKLVQECIMSQNIIETLLKNGASMADDVVSDFGFTALHLLSSVGMNAMADILIQKHSMQTQNSLGQTLIHSAVLRGQLEMLKLLWENEKVTQEMKFQNDRFGRSVQDMICEHGWANMDFAFQEQEEASSYCYAYNKKRIEARPYFQNLQQETIPVADGGWLRKPILSKMEANCDIDVVDGRLFSVNDFLVDYLSLQKPVIMKNGLHGAHWDGVRERWHRLAFGKTYGRLLFERTEIPYAAAFGLESNLTTVSAFMAYMDEQHEASLDGIEDLKPPSYIFSSMRSERERNAEFHDHASLTGEFLLENDFFIPECVGPHVSEIETRSRQFYLGPAGSGAPMHVHSGAWNALVFGRKRWYLVPPAHAFYSIEHPRDFVEEVLPGLKTAKAVLECVQESGDVLFVPEMWSHAILNEAESIGFASEFAWGGNVFSIPPPEDDSQKKEKM
eukprot:m.86761 g.86761  ORF g.86761 m.86761 type:complete len:768 (-) comp8771_c0_seq2:285-2588(-)